MATNRKYTAEEQAEIIRLQNEIAAEEAAMRANELPSESDAMRQRILDAAKRAGVQITYEAGGAAVGQKAGLPLAPYTLGLSVPIAGAIGGAAGYYGAMTQLGEEPTMLGALQAAGMGAIPFAPEARLAATAAGNLARVTAPELASAAGRMGGATLVATVAPKLAAGEELTAMDVIPAVGGAASGAAGRFVGATTAASGIPGRPSTDVARAAGPSKEAAAAAIRRSQNLDRDAQMRNWVAAGGVLDPKQSNPSVVTRTMERSVGESQVMLDELRRINNAKAGELARQQIGMDVAMQLTPDNFKVVRDDLAKAGEAIAAISTTAKNKYKDLQSARDEMRQAWRSWRSARDANMGSTPKLLDEAKAATAKVDKLDKELLKIAYNRKRLDLYNDYEASRPKMAALYTVESATIPGANVLDASVIYGIHEANPKYLTDQLRMIADVYGAQKSVFGKVTEAAATRRLPLGASTIGAGLGGTYGFQAGGAPGAAAGAVLGTLAGGAVGSAISEPAQRYLLEFMTGTTGPLGRGFQRAGGIPQYGTNVPSNLSLFLAKTGAPTGVQVQQFLEQEQQPNFSR
jgi:hypothetical protein